MENFKKKQFKRKEIQFLEIPKMNIIEFPGT